MTGASYIKRNVAIVGIVDGGVDMREESRKRPSANKTDCRRSEVDVLGTIEHRYYSTEAWDCKWGDEMRAFEIINSIQKEMEADMSGCGRH